MNWKCFVSKINIAILLLLLGAGNVSAFNVGTDWTNTTKNLYTTGIAEIGGGHAQISVDTLADLKALNIALTRKSVYVRYRITPGDGGHGHFRWDASDLNIQVAADTLSGIYVPPNSDVTGASGAWVRQYSGEVNIRWFGTKGNGVTNDTSVLAQVLLSFDSVYIPEGVYLTSSPLIFRPGQKISGDGRRKSIILNDTTDVWQREDSATASLYTEITGIGVKRSTPSGATVGFNMTNTQYMWLKDVAATNFRTGILYRRDAVGFGGSNAGNFVYIDGADLIENGYGIWIDNETSGSGNSYNGVIGTNLFIASFDYDWITVGLIDTAGIRYSGYGNKFTNSIIKGNTHHLWRDSKGGSNSFSNIYFYGHVEPSEMFYAPTISTTYYGNYDTISDCYVDTDGFQFYDPYDVFEFHGNDRATGQRDLYARYGVDLVENGTFTTTADNWTASNATLSSVAGGVSGNALKLLQTSSTIAYATQIVPTIVGRSYDFSAWFKYVSGIGGRIYVGSSTVSGEYYYEPSLADAAWTNYTATFTATTTTTYITLATRGTTNYNLFDSISLRPQAATFDGNTSRTGIEFGGAPLLSKTTVSLAANADTTIYTVPAGKTLVLSHAIVVAGDDAGATTTLSIGQDTAETDFVAAHTLSNLDAANDSVILMPIPNATPVKTKAYAAGTIIQAQVANQSGGAKNTVLLFGFLY